MPYTLEELKDLTWYQNLINEDEQQYLNKKSLLSRRSSISGSAYDGNQLIRDESNKILLFENPYQNQIPEDDSTKVVHNTSVKLLKTKESDTIVNEVLDRQFREL